ncbi:Phosphatidylinositol alpha-mannosyltransferase [Kytococcus aerolatus]|uniref:D-inositol 3-phosphate glycosyltransferase n=1 Tax=Kytococcus aerolatus TaxID=592308 RepID=A0A212T2T8_9MICO|nr:glycosyltransferase family 4 protein [Kytococcus aerolatus]SNC60352.1 Phosphatidylinositol alpha-mannosyltransferase [Kytococcus aerolatus]
MTPSQVGTVTVPHPDGSPQRHVGLVCPYPVDAPGAVQAHVRELARSIRSAGHLVSVLAPVEGTHPRLRLALAGEGDEGADAVAADLWGLTEGIDLTVVPGTVRVPYARSVSLVSAGARAQQVVDAWLQSTEPDLVHVHEPVAPSLPLITAQRVGGRIPLVATFHSGLKPSHALAEILPVLRSALESVDARIAVSSQTRATVVETLGGDPFVIPNGVRVKRLARSEPRAPWQEGPGRPTIAFVGRSSESRKGLGLLLRALPRIIERSPGTRVFIAGPGQEHARELVARDHAELRNSIVWVGELSERDKAALLHSVSAFVAPQLQGENFGLTIVEAMASGAPVVASDLPAFRSVLRGAGRLFRAGDAEDLADVLEEVVLDPHLREEMRQTGRARAARFDWEVIGREVMAVYEVVMER